MRSKNLRVRLFQGTIAKQKRHRAIRQAVRPARAAKVVELLQDARALAASLTRVSSKWRWHHRVLLSLRSRLLREREALLQAAAEPLEPHGINEADSATDEFDHDLALAQLSAGQDALYEVNEALNRILNGTYGVCEETGDTIPKARLRAIPWTRFSIEVEDKLEKEGVKSPARMRKAATVRRNGRVSFALEEEAEESEEKSPASPRDEALSKVYFHPGRRVPRPKASQRLIKLAKQKGRSK